MPMDGRGGYVEGSAVRHLQKVQAARKGSTGKVMQASLREALVWPASPEEACVCKPRLIIHSIDPNKKCCAIHQPLNSVFDL